MSLEELTIVYCRNAKNTAEKIHGSLIKICEERHERLKKLGANGKRLPPHRRRSLEFVRDVEAFGIPLVSNGSKEFNDGEIFTTLGYSARGHDVFVVQNSLDPKHPEKTNTNLMELYATIDMVVRAGADRVVAIIPYMSYIKQDVTRGREALTSYLALNFMAFSGADKLLTMDLHSKSVEGFVRPKEMTIENLYASSLLIDYFTRILQKNTVLVGPDANAAKTVQHYAKVTGKPMAIGYKHRKVGATHEIAEHKLLGSVKNKIAIVIDDQVSSGKTFANMAREMKKRKSKEIYLGITHGPLVESTEEALQKMYKEGLVEKIVTTDTLPFSPQFLRRNPYIDIVSAIPFLARAAYEIHTKGSLTKLYSPKLQRELFGLEKITYT